MWKKKHLNITVLLIFKFSSEQKLKFSEKLLCFGIGQHEQVLELHEDFEN